MNKLHCDFCDRVIGEDEPIYHRRVVFSVSKTEKRFDLCEECKGIYDALVKKCAEELRKEIS